MVSREAWVRKEVKRPRKKSSDGLSLTNQNTIITYGSILYDIIKCTMKFNKKNGHEQSKIKNHPHSPVKGSWLRFVTTSCKRGGNLGSWLRFLYSVTHFAAAFWCRDLMSAWNRLHHCSLFRLAGSVLVLFLYNLLIIREKVRRKKILLNLLSEFQIIYSIIIIIALWGWGHNALYQNWVQNSHLGSNNLP